MHCSTLTEVDQLIQRYGIEAVIEAVTPLMADSRVISLDEALEARLSTVTIVLENLYDPHNGAAATRSVEAFGLSDMHVVNGATGSFSASADVSIGAHKWIDTHQHQSAAACASDLKSQGFVLCATVPGATLELEELSVDKPLALWFGNEREGLTAEAQELCDHTVSIAMQGFSQSFNLSVSVALFVHRLAARRRQQIGSQGDLPAKRKRFLQARWRALGIRGLTGVLERHVSA